MAPASARRSRRQQQQQQQRRQHCPLVRLERPSNSSFDWRNRWIAQSTAARVLSISRSSPRSAASPSAVTIGLRSLTYSVARSRAAAERAAALRRVEVAISACLVRVNLGVNPLFFERKAGQTPLMRRVWEINFLDKTQAIARGPFPPPPLPAFTSNPSDQNCRPFPRGSAPCLFTLLLRLHLPNGILQ